MSGHEPTRTTARRLRLALLAALTIVAVGIIGLASTRSFGEADGLVPVGVTVFDDDVPAVANLDPALVAALRHAATDAARNGVRFVINSGWRSPAYQQHLLDDAVSKYGSRREATRWVASADTSRHVSGDAVDIGPSSATKWMATHGARYGLCRIYRNEPWHYELRLDAIGGRCPSMYTDAAHDPRMPL